MKLVKVSNNREHDITLSAVGMEPHTIPAGKPDGDGGKKIVPGTAVVPAGLVTSATEQAVAAQYYFDEGWLELGEETEGEDVNAPKLTAAQKKAAEKAASAKK